ncbi:MAG: hypothetical protein SNJ71_00005 [Bacteroidales bacterium]
MKKIASYPEINPTWLLTGHGPMLKEGTEVSVPEAKQEKQEKQDVNPSRQEAIIEYLQSQLKEKDAKIEELNREIGRLQAQIKQTKYPTT